jgi:hypothetical protein
VQHSDAFETLAVLVQEQHLLKHLAEQFRLADNLIKSGLLFQTLGKKLGKG